MRYPIMVAVVFALAGCASPVIVDYESGTGFGQYDTYAFKPPREGEAVSLDGQRIRAAVKPLMKARGFKRVEVPEADLLLDHKVKETRRVESTGFTFGFGYGHDNVGLGLGSRPEVYEVREGRLVVAFEDRAREQTIWRAESRHDLDPDLTGDKRRQRIERLIGQMFAHFPPAR